MGDPNSVDVVSKNGNMLLNVIQRPDGAIDPEVEKLVADLTNWMNVHSEAIHGTRPWGVYGEGKTQVVGGHFKEDFAFSAEDIRFTQTKNGRSLYAFALGVPPNGELRIRALAKTAEGGNHIVRAELLGRPGSLPVEQTAESLVIKLPQQSSDLAAIAVKLSGEICTRPVDLTNSPIEEISLGILNPREIFFEISETLSSHWRGIARLYYFRSCAAAARTRAARATIRSISGHERGRS